ncbi:MAG: GAF domain-containing protein [Vicinamibacterales bacterium]
MTAMTTNGHDRAGWSAYIETALCLGALLVADAVWGAGDRFRHVEPHPFWVVVLLMAVHYGTREALVASAAASAALLIGNLPPPTLDQTIHDYRLEIVRQPLLWMLAALVLGELRMRHRMQDAERLELLRDAERRVELLSRSHSEITAAKERLETRMAGQLRTATGLFEAARTLETLEPNRVVAGATDLVSIALHARAFSLFLLEGDALVMAAEQGASRDRTWPDRYTVSAPLFREVVVGRRIVSVATAEGESILAGHGLLAGPIIDTAAGKLVGMLKIEDMPFVDFNLSSLQTFKTLCDWIGAAYANAITHQSSQIEDESTRLYGMKYLDRQTEYVRELALRFGFDLTLLWFRVEVDELTDAQRRVIPAALGEVARKVLRRTDLAFSHEPAGTQFAVLLPGAPPENVGAVIAKLRDALRVHCGFDVPCTTRVRGLCRAGETNTRTTLRGESTERERVA